MKDGRFDDAARDYGAAYELSKDPALFFKIGRANQRAGKCEVALSYYTRYLREGKPTEQFTATTREYIAACGGDVRVAEGGGSTASPGAAAGSASAETPRPATETAAPGAAGPVETPAPSAPEPAAAGSASAATGARASPESPTPPSDAPPVLIPSTAHKVAWILSGTAIALATLGGVLAYAASSSENDVRDLYVGFAGQPPAFDAQTRKRYDDLVDQGHRYEHLSWASFGLAGAAAAGAAVLFVLGGRDEAPRVAPVITPAGAGVAVRF